MSSNIGLFVAVQTKIGLIPAAAADEDDDDDDASYIIYSLKVHLLLYIIQKYKI